MRTVSLHMEKSLSIRSGKPQSGEAAEAKTQTAASVGNRNPVSVLKDVAYNSSTEGLEHKNAKSSK